ncbi:MAG: hypothetical protein WAW37_09170 [Syntrophobacteraceae bacterium]
MPDIRYVCLSDMHFGAETSLLTNLKTASMEIDASKPSPVLEELVVCLKSLIDRNEVKSPKPTLILNGDILELALARDNQAAMCFERFIDLIMPEDGGLFERIVYNPGNHDHHLWETARETQYVDFISTDPGPGIPWGKSLDEPWHATSAFKYPEERLVRSHFLTKLVQRRPNLREFIVETAYPNFGLLGEDGRRAVIFHHGHFTEDMYVLMSVLKTMLFPDSKLPVDVWDWERENFAWIDFFWSTLGRSGDVGKGVGRVYEKLQDEKQFKRLLANLAEGLAKRFDIPLLTEGMEAELFEKVLRMVADAVGSLERNQPDAVLSEDAEKGLWRYVEGPLKLQIKEELRSRIVKELGKPVEKELEKWVGEELERRFPSEVRFVFGHTHKPFERDMNFNGYPEWVDVYNSGGWVVDSVKRRPLHGGAVILLDEDLNAASLRMYNECDELEDYKVWVAEAGHPGDVPGPLFARLAPLVKEDRDPWKKFLGAVARSVSVRAEDLRARINSPDY